MNKHALKLCVILALAMGFATQAYASLQLAVGDAFYVGLIDDGIPSSPTNEVTFINTLTTLAAGGGPTTIGSETYDRIGSSLAGPFDPAVVTDAFKDETGNNIVDFGSMTFQYVLGKYDGPNFGSLVWYNAAGFTGEVEIPATAGRFDLSHLSGYNKGVIPEPVSLLVWGGLAAVAAAVVHRRRASRIGL